MATTQETYELVNVALGRANDAIDAQLCELTLRKDLEYAQEKIKSLEDRIVDMAGKMSEHFDRRARYIYLKEEVQAVLLALHHNDDAMAQNSYQEIHKRVHAKALEKLQTFKANQKQAQADFDKDETVAAAQHRVDCAKAALELRDKLANEVFVKATQRVAALDKHVRKRGREDVANTSECLSNVQKVQKQGPGAPEGEAPAPAEEEASASAPAEEAPMEGAEPHPGTLGVKAPKAAKPKQTDAEKAAAKAEKERAAQAKKDEKERLAQAKRKEAEEKKAKAKADKARAVEEKKANGKKKEPPAASATAPVAVSRPKGGKAGKAGKAGPASVKQYWQGLDSTKAQFAQETKAAQDKGGQTWTNWHKTPQAWYEDAWGRVTETDKKWLTKKFQGGGSDGGGADKEGKEGKEGEPESEAEAMDTDGAPERNAAREDEPKGDSVQKRREQQTAGEPDSDKEKPGGEGEEDSGGESDDESGGESDDESGGEKEKNPKGGTAADGNDSDSSMSDSD